MTESPILLVPDVHQDGRFLRRCVAIGRDRGAGEIILLGDLLDPKSRAARLPESIRETLATARELLDRADPPTLLLWGNHDWKYWACRDLLRERARGGGDDPDFFLLRDLAPLTAGELTRTGPDGPDDFLRIWERAVLAVERRGWLITHAGVHPELWPAGKEPAAGARRLNERMAQLAEEAGPDDPDPLLGAGPARGGFHEIGGPLWLDFNEEFVDDLPFPQAVGHTRCAEVLRKGRSLCLDVCQSVCALLHGDGRMEVMPLDSA